MKPYSIVVFVLLTVVPWRPADIARAARGADDVDQRVAKLIEQLGDGQYAVRERAQQELVKLGFDAFDALSEAENHDDPEIAMQAGYLVRLIRVDWTHEGDPRQVQMVLKDYEGLSDDRRLLKIKQLAELPGDMGLEWLCRLVRFERSPVLSKQAALAIMGSTAELDDADWSRRAETITKTLRRGRRPAVQWLNTYLQAHSDPAGALEKWSALTGAERQVLEQHPQETSGQIVAELLRRKIDMLDRLGRGEDVADVMHQIVLCERGDSASLAELIDWLARRKAWTTLDEVATRFAASFDIDPVLTYALCEARLAQGDKEQAEKTAEKALQLSGDKTAEHMGVVARLLERGLTDGADREMRYVIKLGPPGSRDAVVARIYLSESLHDRALDQQAADVLKELVDAADKDPNLDAEVRRILQQIEKPPNLVRAHMYYYQACRAAAEKDPALERKLLDMAIAQDPSDVDALIALYRATHADPAARATVVAQIKVVVDECRKEIDDAPDEPTFYNQVAWIIANTEGDLDEALRFSLKSVELARASATAPGEVKRIGGLLDTLGHCYYARRDYVNAVKYQTEAATLDPHTQTIGRQLKVFREALARQQAEGKPQGDK